MIYQGSRRYPVQEIVIHCTATRPDFLKGATSLARFAEIRRWHTDPPPKGRGWKDIGYHWLIDRDGTVMQGRKPEVIGAHVEGHNAGTLGISLFGGHGSSSFDRFRDHFTSEQEAALRDLIIKIKGMTSVKRISGHNEYATKACPGFDVPSKMRDMGLM